MFDQQSDGNGYDYIFTWGMFHIYGIVKYMEYILWLIDWRTGIDLGQYYDYIEIHKDDRL